jgi:hypothetical protein
MFQFMTDALFSQPTYVAAKNTGFEAFASADAGLI